MATEFRRGAMSLHRDRPAETGLSGRIPLHVHSGQDVPALMLEFGFQALPEVGDTTPFSHAAGEAEAEWVRTDQGLAWLDYREMPGALLDALWRSLPRLTANDVLARLQSTDAQARRLGLRQAGQVQDDRIIEAILALREDADPLVAEDATALCSELLGQRLASPQDAYHAFDATLDGHDRRQVLRWMLADQSEPNEAVQAVVQAALEDPDWEVRATALIACARFGLLPLAEHVSRCSLPTVSRLGPVKLDRDMLFAIKQAVLWSFMKEPLPETAPGSLKPWRWWHIRRLVLGLPPAREDHAFLLVHALATPQPVVPTPERLPAGVEETATGYRLAGTDLALAWVPPVPHWLGDEGLPENPLRQQAQPGFFIARDVLRRGDEPELLAVNGAEGRLVELGLESGAHLGMPSAAQWEAAARGTDGRRFPWGNGYEAGWMWRGSPWGLLGLFGESPCHCLEGRLAGGEKVVSIAQAVLPGTSGAKAALRPVVNTGE